MAPRDRTTLIGSLNHPTERIHRLLSLVAPLLSLFFIPVPAHAQLERAIIESLTKRDPQCGALRRAVLNRMGQRISSSCERAIDSACEAMKAGRLANVSSIAREIAYACSSDGDTSTAKSKRKCKRLGRDYRLRDLGLAIRNGSTERLIRLYNVLDNPCTGSIYSLMELAASEARFEFVQFLARQGVPRQIAVIHWPDQESMETLFDRLRPDATKRFPTSWSNRSNSWKDLAERGDITTLFEYSIKKGRLDIFEAAANHQYYALRAKGNDYFLTAAKSGQKNILLFLAEKNISPSNVKPNDRAKILETLLTRQDSSHHAEGLVQNLLDRYYSSEIASTAFRDFDWRSPYDDVARLALTGGYHSFLHRLIDDGFPVDYFHRWDQISLRSAIIEAGISGNSVGLSVAPHEAVIGYIRYIIQKHLIVSALFPIFTSAVPFIVFFAFNGRRRYFRSRVGYFLCSFAILMWLAFVTFTGVLVIGVFPEAAEEFASLRNDDYIALVTVGNWAVVALVGMYVRRRWKRIHASTAT